MIPLILAALLSHPDFTVRESASASLQRLGPPVLPLLDTFITKCPDAQYRLSVIAERIRSRHLPEKTFPKRQQAAEDARRILAAMPGPIFIDAIPGEPNWNFINHYLGMAEMAGIKAWDPQANTWPTYEAAVKYWVVDQLFDGIVESEICTQLAVMQTRSAYWKKLRRWEP